MAIESQSESRLENWSRLVCVVLSRPFLLGQFIHPFIFHLDAACQSHQCQRQFQYPTGSMSLGNHPRTIPCVSLGSWMSIGQLLQFACCFCVRCAPTWVGGSVVDGVSLHIVACIEMMPFRYRPPCRPRVPHGEATRKGQDEPCCLGAGDAWTDSRHLSPKASLTSSHHAR